MSPPLLSSSSSFHSYSSIKILWTSCSTHPHTRAHSGKSWIQEGKATLLGTTYEAFSQSDLSLLSPFLSPCKPCPWPFSIAGQALNMPTILAPPCLLQSCFLCLDAFQHSLTEHRLSLCYRLNLGCRGRVRLGAWKMKIWPFFMDLIITCLWYFPP